MPDEKDEDGIDPRAIECALLGDLLVVLSQFPFDDHLDDVDR